MTAEPLPSILISLAVDVSQVLSRSLIRLGLLYFVFGLLYDAVYSTICHVFVSHLDINIATDIL